LLEYLLDLDCFFEQVRSYSKSYIFTFYNSKKRKGLNNPNKIKLVADFEEKLSLYFEITDVVKTKEHNIYVCKDVNDV
jgi:hypothetical protein